MKQHPSWLTGVAGFGLGLALLSACRPDSPTAAATVRNHDNLPAGPFRSGDADETTAQDTLHTADGTVLYLKPVTDDYFARQPEPLISLLDSALTAGNGPVQRQGKDLLFRPAQGPAVRLSAAQGTQHYWGELPTAHQWVVLTAEESRVVTTLIDTRTGHRTVITGTPAVSPDGRHLIGVKSDQLNDGSGTDDTGIQLYQLGAGPPRLLWTREPMHWGATRARWSGPRTVVLEQEHPSPSQEDAGPPNTYAELTVPAAQ